MPTRRTFLKALAVAPLLALRPSLTAARRRADGPNFIVLVFDAWSAGHCSLYGYPRDTTPHLRRLAARATVYHRHYAGGSYTVPGTASLLTGLTPWRHRAWHLLGTTTPEAQVFNVFGRLRAAGYQTLAFTQNIFADILLSQFGADLDRHIPLESWALSRNRIPTALRRLLRDDAQMVESVNEALYSLQSGATTVGLYGRFVDSLSLLALHERYGETYPAGIPFAGGQRNYFLLEDVLGGLAQATAESERGFFAYYHLMSPHAPYTPRADFFGRFADDGYTLPVKPYHPLESDRTSQDDLNYFCRLYDEYIALVDFELARFYAALEQSGLLDNTYLIVTSDHGEMFERGLVGHMSTLLSEPIVHVPLVIFGPGQTQRRDVHDLTSAVDLAGTLAALAGAPALADDGVRLPGLGGAAQPGRPVFALDAKRNSKFRPLQIGTAAAWQGTRKLVHYFGYETADYAPEELFDLALDPLELDNRAAADPAAVAALRALLPGE